MTTEPNTLRAHAKLTLSLKMTGIRPDRFHLIDAEMISLDLHDVLVFDPNRIGLAVTGKFSDGVPADESNLVARALGLAGGTAHVTIDKQIPHGGGLGGGSTDAATALARAAELGADIAFCLVGGRSRVTGIGEILEPLPHVDRSVTLIVPPLRVSTPAVYRAWDDLGGPTVDGPNDLEPAAITVEPLLAQWRDRIGERCGRTPTLAGSGATWFVEGEHHNALTDLVDEGAHVALAHAVPSDFATNRTS
jgi:4-diphosphocytidyl-2-C-methyl-D-erythritol kinase